VARARGAKLPPITEDTMPGELPNIVAGRVANVLNLRGPNFITDAACASASPLSTRPSRCSPSTTWMR
jgi:acyl transferase domain-containing protein